MKWTVDVSRVQPEVRDVVRGETVALEATLQCDGKPFATGPEPVCIFWQTNGMGSAWWSVPASVTNHPITQSSNQSILSATFTPEMDPGAPTVNGFLGSSGSMYRAIFTLRFRHGPGAVPNLIEQPPRVLDLARTVVVNPPWPTQADFSATTAVMREELKGYVDGQIGDAGVVSPQIATNIASGVASNVVEAAVAAHHDETKLDKTGGTITREEGEPVSLIVLPDMADMNVKFGSFSFTDNDAGDSSKFSVGNFKLETVIDDDGWYGAMKMSVDGDGAAISVNGTDVMSELAAKRDRDDNTCRKTEAGEFLVSTTVNIHGYDVDLRWLEDGDERAWEGTGWYVFGSKDGYYALNDSYVEPFEDRNALTFEFWADDWDYETEDWVIALRGTATRSAVCVSNETFVTPTFVTSAVKVKSVNGETGDVEITPSSIGAAAASDVSALSADVGRVYNYMNGNTNSWFSGTNYTFGADAAMRQKFAWEEGMDAAAVPCSLALFEHRDGAKQCVWDQRDWTAWYWSFKARQMWAEIGHTNDDIYAEISSDANHAWAKRYASTGRVNPDPSTTFVDTPSLCLSPGMNWETVATVGGCGYWTIVGNGATIGGSGTNAFLQVKDFEGNDILTITKGEHRLAWVERADMVGSLTDGDGFVCFDMMADVQPKGFFSTTLGETADFVAEDEAACPAQCSWENRGGGVWRIHYLLKPGISASACFAMFQVEVEGKTQIRYNADTVISGGLIFDGVKIAPVIPSGAAVGSTVTWKVVAQ